MKWRYTALLRYQYMYNDVCAHWLKTTGIISYFIIKKICFLKQIWTQGMLLVGWRSRKPHRATFFLIMQCQCKHTNSKYQKSWMWNTFLYWPKTSLYFLLTYGSKWVLIRHPVCKSRCLMVLLEVFFFFFYSSLSQPPTNSGLAVTDIHGGLT